MKKHLLLFGLLFSFFYSKAQFSGDTLNPFNLVISGSQPSGLNSFSDGNGGYYVFWLDKRNNSNIAEIYGQHLDAVGHELWTSGGKAIMQHPKSTTALKCIKMKNNILVTWLQSQDSIVCKSIDANGNDVWPAPVVLGRSAVNSIIYIDNSGFNAFETDSGAFITYSNIYTGGSSGFAYNHVYDNGTTKWPVGGQTMSVSGYDFRSASDRNNGFYLLGKGNGIGSGMYIKHISMQGVMTWAGEVEITGGSTNGFAGTIFMDADNTGNLFIAWDANNSKTMACKLNYSDGTFAWAGQRIEAASFATQSRSSALLTNNRLYMAWNDSRTGSVSHVYMQAVDTSGNKLWNTDGMDAGETNYYYNYPKMAVSDSNAVCLIYDSPSLATMAQRIRPDSTLTWPGGVTLSHVSGEWISYSSYNVLNDTAGCNAVFYLTMQSGKLIGSKLCNGVLVNLEEKDATAFIMYPNPANDFVQIASSENITDINIYDINGRSIVNRSGYQSKEVKIDISALNPGIYLLTAGGAKGIQSRKLIVQ